VLLIQVGLDAEPYSNYALTVLAGTSLLSGWVVVWEMRVLRHGQAVSRWVADLRASVGHGPGLAIVAGLLPVIALVGLGPAVAVGVAVLTGCRQASDQRGTGLVFRSVLAGLLCGGLLHWLVFDWANLSLEPGWLPRIFNEWTMTR